VNIDDGGAAFPCPGANWVDGDDVRLFNYSQMGMSLRNYYAGEIVKALISKIPLIDQTGELGLKSADKLKLNADVAESSFWLADAMIAASKKELQ
jgi:hypothetical protein